MDALGEKGSMNSRSVFFPAVPPAPLVWHGVGARQGRGSKHFGKVPWKQHGGQFRGHLSAMAATQGISAGGRARQGQRGRG